MSQEKKLFHIFLYWQNPSQPPNATPHNRQFRDRKEAAAFIDSLENGEVTKIWTACIQKMKDESQHLRLFTRTAIGWIRSRELENRLNPIVPPALRPVTTTNKILTGARAELKVNGKTVGFVNNVALEKKS